MYTIVKYYDDGKIKSQSWFKNNHDKHNDNGPAKTIYYQNGNICEVHYFVNNTKHRLDEPASIIYYKNGTIKFKFYYNNGKYHNSHGPAIFEYNRDGHITTEAWYYKGREYTEEVNEWLEINNVDYMEEKMNFNHMWMEIL